MLTGGREWERVGYSGGESGGQWVRVGESGREWERVRKKGDTGRNNG